MCNFFSAIITRGHRVHAYFNVDSHEDIIELSGLKEMNVRGEPTFVRCELTPNAPMTLDFNQWNFVVDQDIRPEWFDSDKAHKAMIKYLQGVPAILEPANIIYEQYYFAQAPIKRMIGRACVRFLLKGSQVGVMRGSSQVGVMRGSSQVGVMRGSSQVGEMRESSRVGEMWESSRVGEMRESSQVGVMRGSSQVGVMRGSSKIKDDYRKK